MKTREEVEDLKRQWLRDPCWDIEDTPGFEEYAVELAGFAVEHRKIWRAAREKTEAEAYRNTPANEATLRDVFATAALTWLARTASFADVIAERAYKIADAMMAERKKMPA